MASNWYRAGKINVASGSKNVTGVGCLWLTAAQKPLPGDALIVNGEILEVESINSDDTLTLFDEYKGSNLTNSDYAIMRNTSLNPNARLMAQVSEVLNRLGSQMQVSTSVPSAGSTKHGDIVLVIQE
ncbi:hypothetical protein J7384_17820 [Endozoicomonas sp. G2_1]|uniref:hypothetical protein n=1 Tax=Endozoicomonas sp. G2_1 TaxID=2821091 RepID=UPI001ADA6735|nr:hypothetical protein [Endozoicomonas sp. G2_1]MBO9492224.1 hypothetical protein [Endozoicomonas sp. G2_1]